MNAAVERGIQRFLIDGFPRSLDQAVTFEEKVPYSSWTYTFIYANVINVLDSRTELHHTLRLQRGHHGRSAFRTREGIR